MLVVPTKGDMNRTKTRNLGHCKVRLYKPLVHLLLELLELLHVRRQPQVQVANGEPDRCETAKSCESVEKGLVGAAALWTRERCAEDDVNKERRCHDCMGDLAIVSRQPREDCNAEGDDEGPVE